MKNASSIHVLMLSAVIALAGCGSEAGYTGPTGTVSGKITFNGTPVPAGCGVTFRDTGKAGHTGAGAVAADGAYSLKVLGAEKIPVGSYQVTVSPPPSGPVDEKAVAEAMQSGDDSKLPKSLPPPFPAKYMDPENSGLKFDVKEGKNALDITLTE